MQEPATTSDAVVAVEGVSKVYRPTPMAMRMMVRTTIHSDVTALDGISLRVEAGQTVALVGPNGAGKTTLFRILTGLTTPTTGEAKVLGLDVDTQSLAVRRMVGFMQAEDRALFMRMSCLENLVFHARLQHIPRRDLRSRCMEALEDVGLASQAQSSVFALSAGMRARLQLARAIVHRPRLLILDEPTGAVDPVGAHELLLLVQRLVREHNLATLISSHRLEEIESLGSNVVLLDRGRIRYHGDLSTLRDQWRRPAVEMELDSIEAAKAACTLLGTHGVEVHRSGTEVECRLPAGWSSGQLFAILNSVADRLVHIREANVPLRDILAEMYAGPPPAVKERA
ncbi:ABC transporter ATP-binding protein [Nocardioides mesophilus]|uniref:ABC transporter ATP-binding protein n=1 Tax=Nocardioides mesophilus TaxID=433659 RepID=A0A7G9RCZ0_9ACTN|nr:ABC transporter ATP-binding protein [Nocardioides mesophilus]QNN53465.1 ABC transporter ATP-binding protein [Nocardioides mesophilus]